MAPVNQLYDAVDDEGDQDQNGQNPRDEHHGLAVPRRGLGFLVERVERLGLLVVGRDFRRGRRAWWGSARRRASANAEVGVLGRLIVEVVRRAIACHGTDGTDITCQTARPAKSGRVGVKL